MANIVAARPVPLGAVTTLTVVNFFSNIYDNFVAASRAAKTRKALSGLSHSQLDDIGLMPGDIHKIAPRLTLLH